MTQAFIAVAANLGSVACVIAAAVLAYRGTPGWGWFLFVALLLKTSVTLEQ